MKVILKIFLLSNILFLSNLSILNAQSSCDSTLINLIDVQDSAIVECEFAYLEMKMNFDLINESYRLQNQNFSRSLDVFEREIIQVRKELEDKQRSQKRLIRRRSLQFGIIGGSLGFVLGKLIQ